MNRNMLVKAFIFVAGATIGSAVTWKVIKNKYEQITQEEIKSVKEEYSRLSKLMRIEIDACHRVTEAHTEDEATDSDDSIYNNRDFSDPENNMVEYHKLTSKYRGTPDKSESNEEGDGDGIGDDDLPFINGPYVISPDEFASSPPGYSACPIDYYKDGILADGWGVKLNIEETIGEDAINHFGDYVDDVVHVRNERTQIDYEVTRDPRTYKEAEWAYSDPNSHYTR